MNRRDILKLAGIGPTIAPMYTTSGVERDPTLTMDVAEYHLCIYGRGSLSHMLVTLADDAQFSAMLDDELKKLRQSILDYRDQNRKALVDGSST